GVEPGPGRAGNGPKPVLKAPEPLLPSKIDSWQTGVNRNVEGRTVRRVLGYNGNGVHYRRKCDEVASGGYPEIAVRGSQKKLGWWRFNFPPPGWNRGGPACGRPGGAEEQRGGG